MFNKLKESVKKNERKIFNTMCMAPGIMFLNPEMIRMIVEEERALEDMHMHR